MAELEKMADFFAKRVQGYEEQMLEHVEGCKQGTENLRCFCQTL